ncbi:MAG: electron transfer flavoprotein subunit beta/FixA family protein [bacterium]
MNVLVCVKRVPATGARIVLTEDAQEIETRNLGFTVSPHEECAVEEAVRIKEAHGGETTVLTLGPAEAAEQLRDALALGIDRAVLLPTGGEQWDASATAAAIADAVRREQEEGREFDVLLFGNESADAGNYQVAIRVAYLLGLPCVSGVKDLAFEDGRVTARRQVDDGWEVYEVPLPAVFAVKEGINVPRYPSLPGRMKAKRKEIGEYEPTPAEPGLEKVRLMNPPEQESDVEMLGQGPEAVPRIVEILDELGVA